MDEEHRTKAMEIRVRAGDFLDPAEITMLAACKAELLQTAARLTVAANALEEIGLQVRCA